MSLKPNNFETGENNVPIHYFNQCFNLCTANYIVCQCFC